MYLTKRLILFACLGLCCTSVLIARVETTTASGPREDLIKTVDFCELVSCPEKYLQKVTRTVAVYSETFEGNGLSKSDCPAGKNIRDTIWGRVAVAEIELDCKKLKLVECSQLKSKLRQNLTGNPLDGLSSEVQVVGWIEILSNVTARNDMNGSPIRFHVRQVESVIKTSNE